MMITMIMNIQRYSTHLDKKSLHYATVPDANDCSSEKTNRRGILYDNERRDRKFINVYYVAVNQA